MSRHVADYMTRLHQSKTFRLTDAEDTREHYLYRVYDGRDHLLYIGCAVDVTSRIYLHMQVSSQSLTSHILQRHVAYYTVEGPFPTRLAARDAERAAIKAEAPALNKQHNPSFNADLYDHLRASVTRDLSRGILHVPERAR